MKDKWEMISVDSLIFASSNGHELGAFKFTYNVP